MTRKQLPRAIGERMPNSAELPQAPSSAKRLKLPG